VSKPTVTVHVNRGSPETLEAAVGTFETAESFDLILEGHDTPSHVHCRLVGPVEDVARLSQPNYYVEPDARTPVPIDVAAEAIDEPVEGTLEVLTGYGAESVSIRIVVEPAPGPVDIDESLANPNPNPNPNPNRNRNRRQNRNRTSTEASTPPLSERIDAVIDVSPATLAALVAGAVILVIATLVTAVVGGSVVPLGVLFLVLVIAALGVLYR
jgi:hypothetical protein